MALLRPRLVMKTHSQQAGFSSPSHLSACRNHTEMARRRLSPGFKCFVKVPVLRVGLFVCVEGVISHCCVLCFGQLSPALRNRFTEIWCPQSNSRSDLVHIIQHNLRPGLSLEGKLNTEPTSLCRCSSVSVYTFITTSGNFQLFHTFRDQNVQNITGRCLFEFFKLYLHF